jgi:glycosyltransferase involved in cell wall biosynthesis
LSLRFRDDVRRLSARAVAECERLERQSFSGLAHVFTCGGYVRDNLIDHYGLQPERVTAVGSGMGPIVPYVGPKDYGKGRLLFVARRGFTRAGGTLLTEGFLGALAHRPDLLLTIVGDERGRSLVPSHPQIAYRTRVPWAELQRLYRRASLLVQPTANEPWGETYLEALASRTPVMGFDRNGLPEIAEDGRHGFLLAETDPDALTQAILDAVSDPGRLARMGQSGQRHVVQAYSWDRVARQIAHA